MRTNPLRKVSDICLAFPEATVERHGSHATFRVRKKVFAYFLDNHHGDGIVSVCVKTRLGENQDLARDQPSRFYLPAYIGPRGWVGVRLDFPKVSWNEVAAFIASSFAIVAPKTLAAAARRNVNS
ncbi:MAG TPA: MmcQ/YjbR family DNA-binding protein [Thermoanaerobaculia bacterium]|nr:MmcQ/YjbR family DNA-binding protein [Thermoanaerobaculia bacterium]